MADIASLHGVHIEKKKERTVNIENKQRNWSASYMVGEIILYGMYCGLWMLESIVVSYMYGCMNGLVYCMKVQSLPI